MFGKYFPFFFFHRKSKDRAKKDWGIVRGSYLDLVDNVCEE